MMARVVGYIGPMWESEDAGGRFGGCLVRSGVEGLELGGWEGSFLSEAERPEVLDDGILVGLRQEREFCVSGDMLLCDGRLEVEDLLVADEIWSGDFGVSTLGRDGVSTPPSCPRYVARKPLMGVRFFFLVGCSGAASSPDSLVAAAEAVAVLLPCKPLSRIPAKSPTTSLAVSLSFSLSTSTALFNQ